MEYEEYEKLIEELQAQLREAGIRGLSDDALYLTRDPESGVRYLPHPRTHFVEMLRALDRYLAVCDRDTYDLALRIINRSIIGSEVSGAEITLSDRRPEEADAEITRSDREPRRIDFASLQSLRKVRRKVNDLIGALEDPKPGPDPDPEPDPEPDQSSSEDNGVYPQAGP